MGKKPRVEIDEEKAGKESIRRGEESPSTMG
jgi:hypothetical protein